MSTPDYSRYGAFVAGFLTAVALPFVSVALAVLAVTMMVEPLDPPYGVVAALIVGVR